MEQRVLFQLHIPKTGGTSLFSMLSTAVGQGRWHLAFSRQELEERTTGFALLGGHFDWDVLALFPEQPQVLTVLRDPVDLALSAYGYWRMHANDGVFSAAAQLGADEANARSFDELVLDPTSQLRSSLGNMTYYLAGKQAAIGGEGVAAALQHLDTCAWVGTTATLDRDAQVLPAMLGLGPIEDAARRMVNPDRPQRDDISPEALRVLEALTENDRVLYDRARAIAEEQQRQYA